jgi:hypothetical protein
MAKKKSITSSEIILFYMEYVLEHGTQPKSIQSFTKANNFEEINFYQHFANFEVLEQSIFQAFFDNTHDILHKTEDYISFDHRGKLLSFYYTFFEILTANRSYVVYVLENNKNNLNRLHSLIKLRNRFTLYIEHLNIPLYKVNQETLEKIQNKSLKESTWFQLLFTIKFWLDDTSPLFEKTDIFIEKSVNTTFDLIDTKPLKSIIDLGKFLYKEKIQMN